MDTTSAPSERRWPAIVTSEACGVLVIVALVFAKLAGVDGSGWRAVFLANGDSLTLPLILKSLELGEPFHWVFSSQTFFFPDFPLYALCALIMGSVQGALVLNAILNVLLMYLGFRGFARAVWRTSRSSRLMVSVLAVVIFLVAALSETDVSVVPPGTVEPARIATEFLMTTYYSGVIIVALIMLALAYWVAQRFDGSSPRLVRVAVYTGVVVLVGSATTFSNQLYMLWFVAPLGAALVVALLLRRISLRMLLTVLAPQVVALGVGTLFRTIFSQFIAANYANYIGTDSPSDAAAMLLNVVREWLSGPQGVVRLVILVGLLLVTVVRLVHGLRSSSLTSGELLIALFVIASTLSLVVGIIVTGQTVTRYLIPLFVFPQLSLFLLKRARVRPLRPRLRRRARWSVALILCVASVVAIGLSAPPVAALASPRPPVDVACLDDWLTHNTGADRAQANGVGDFWTVRALALYGHQTGALVQVYLPTEVHGWMNNLWLYEHRTFSYVLVDRNLTASAVIPTLGHPARVVRCSGYSIYDYRHTSGERIMNQGIEQSLATLSLRHRY